ncbi:MAG: response regulator transcription factor [Xanthomonadaceae bacterium]|jgi:DNA-binding NarL/FixJ family response regulator|nr:response regulator transcription factor [Xanthomonadaceae bacterium]
MPSVLIADDHPLFRQALRQAATEAVPGLLTFQAESLEEALQQLDGNPDIDLVLLDLHMPGNHGLAGLAAIRSQFPAVGVMVVSANDDTAVIRRALDHGAMGYLPKRSDIALLGEAILTVIDGQQWLPPGLRESVARTASREQDISLASGLSRLTAQQFRVLTLVADGLLNKQIADRLGIQERTVKAHLTAIFERLDVRNRTQAGVVLRELAINDPSRRLED